jgi:hypothetical protein
LYKCETAECTGYVYTYTHNDNIIHKCCICDSLFCPHCHEPFHGDKPCDKKIVASIKAIAADTKPCPNCTARVFKIEGCHQMFCTACNTPFDWVTGKKIVNKTIHNPHYSDYLAKLQKNKGPQITNPCDPQNAINLFNDAENYLKFDRYICKIKTNYLSKYKNGMVSTHCLFAQNGMKLSDLSIENNKDLANTYTYFYVYPRDITQMFYSRSCEIREYIASILANKTKWFDDLRVSLILKSITEEYFASQIGLSELKFEKYEAIIQIINNFAQIVDDYLMSMTLDNYKTHISELYNIYTLTNDALANTGEMLQMRVRLIDITKPYIGETWGRCPPP